MGLPWKKKFWIFNYIKQKKKQQFFVSVLIEFLLSVYSVVMQFLFKCLSLYLYNSWYIHVCNHKRIIIGLYILMLLFALKHIFIYCIHAGTSTLMDTFFMKKNSKNRWRKIQTESMEHSLRNWVGPSFCSFLWSMIKTVICW